MTLQSVVVRLALLLTGFAQMGFAQIVPAQDANPATNLQFEVASVKPSEPGARGPTFYYPQRDRFQVNDITVKGLIAYAYDVREFQIEGASGWLASDRYDVVAKMDGEPPERQVRAMVQSLLAGRMNLKNHKETRDMSVLILTVAKGGAKLQKTATPGGPTMRGGEGRLTGQNLTMDMLASLLANRVERPVLNQTGMPGHFDIHLEWSEPEGDGTGPSIFTAVQEQLGLRLETGRAPTDMVVIDHVDRPSPN